MAKPSDITDLQDAMPSATLAAFEAGLKSAEAQELFPGMIVHHKDFTITDNTAARREDAKRNLYGPPNSYGTLQLLTPESFGRAVINNKDANTQVFADNEKSEITAVFDYIKDGGSLTLSYDAKSRGWGQHRATIGFRDSRKLMEWHKTTQWMTQMDFANFLEDHLEDVLTPSGQELLSITTDLEASSAGSFKGKLNLENGSVRLSYQDDVETSVEIPRNLVLGIPLFEHGDRYKLGARLRYVIRGGSVQFRLLFTNLQDSKEAEFERIVQEIEASTSTVIYRGRLVM